MLALRSIAFLVTAGAAVVVLAGCASNAPASSTPAAAATSPATAPSVTGPATATPTAPATSATAAPATPTATASAAPVTASAPATTSPAAGCATAAGALAHSSIAVCPAAGAVGSVVHVTIKNCAPTGSGLPDLPAADLHFLGPKSWLGTNGGGGATVPFSPRTGSEATATFTIPATYTGGNENGPYPTLNVTPGTGYEFITDPAGECHVPFTVTQP